MVAALIGSAVVCAAGAAPAAGADVASGSLSWTHFNHRTGTGQPAVSNCPVGATCSRTFLGYTTGIGANPPPPGGSNGAHASAPASGPAVTPTSPFSADVLAPVPYTWVFPAPASAAGTFDPGNHAADTEFRGTLSFQAHGTTFFTFTNPRIVLNGGPPDGTDGQIFASGQNTGEMGSTAPAPSYDRAAHVHDLDLRGATTTTNSDGSTTIAGMIPNLNLAGFAGLAGFGQGSDRAPNSQGSFAVTLSSAAAPAPAAGAAPAPMPAPTSRPASKNKGRTSIGGVAAIRLQGAALRGLRSRGVRIAASGGAKADARSIRLPVSSGAVAGWASLRHEGAVTLRTGRRSVRLTAFRTTLRSRSAFVSALVGKRRVTLFTSRPGAGAVQAETANESITLKATSLTLTAAGARAIRAALRLRRLAGGRFGMLAINARPAGSSGATTTRLTRPAAGADLASAEVTWNVRESFIRYIGTGEGTSVSAGAVADPPVVIPPTDVPLSYAFHFPFGSGWRDPASGKAVVKGSGAVTFSFGERGIKIATADPEVVLDGKRSHASFVLRGSAGQKLTGKRVVLMDLDPAKAAGTTTSPDGRTITYDRIPGTIPQGAQTSVFAGFYVPGESFGSISIAMTRP